MHTTFTRRIGLSLVLACSFGAVFAPAARAQHSVARDWNELLLDSIRRDFARPTVHARNLYHVSIAMWDAWATYSPTSDCVLFDAQLVG